MRRTEWLRLRGGPCLHNEKPRLPFSHGYPWEPRARKGGFFPAGGGRTLMQKRRKGRAIADATSTADKDLKYCTRWLAEERFGAEQAAELVAQAGDGDDQVFALYRALVNTREPIPVPDEWLAAQNRMLQARIVAAGVTDAGVQLRAECARIMAAHGHEEPTANAKVTPAYNLPARYVIHTAGPIAQGRPTARHRMEIARCYRACLDAAAGAGCQSIAFCCISTGVFGFPQEAAAEIAVRAVCEWLDAHAASGDGGSATPMHVVFNVFTPADEAIYSRLLG